MLKNKYYLISLEVLCLVALVLVCFWVYKNNLNSNTIKRKEAVGVIGANEHVQAQTTTNELGLQVAPNSVSSDLKQLSLNNNSTNNSSNSENSAPPAIDPKTFGQYEKYKNEKNAMFGEIQVGTGAELTANKKAAVTYKLWLTDGKLVDSSRTDEKGQVQPFIFTLGAHEVIVGWEQAMAGMKVGGTRLVIVPPSVGYGVAGKDPIPGNAVLVFQVQLVAVQ